MKEKLSLMKLNEMSKLETDSIKGGQVWVSIGSPCGCACAWAGCGGSSSGDNYSANFDGRLNSAPGGC